VIVTTEFVHEAEVQREALACGPEPGVIDHRSAHLGCRDRCRAAQAASRRSDLRESRSNDVTVVASTRFRHIDVILA